MDSGQVRVAGRGGRLAVGSRAVLWCVLVAGALQACAASSRLGRYSGVIIDGADVRAAGQATALEALRNHRDIIVNETRIGFKGGDDYAFGSARQAYYIPLLAVDGVIGVGQPVSVLGRISADELLYIRLYRGSEVPPQYRRDGYGRGLIEVVTN